MQTDFLQFIYQAINNMLTQNLGFFDAMGQNLFRMFATILVAWYGVKIALSAASGTFASFRESRQPHPDHQLRLRMVNYYNGPSPASAQASTTSSPTNPNSLRTRSRNINCRQSLTA